MRCINCPYFDMRYKYKPCNIVDKSKRNLDVNGNIGCVYNRRTLRKREERNNERKR